MTTSQPELDYPDLRRLASADYNATFEREATSKERDEAFKKGLRELWEEEKEE